MIAKVPPEWWTSAEGYAFLRKQASKKSWAEMLLQMGFDAWFTLTFRDPASSAILALDRTTRLMKKAHKAIGIDCNAFVVAEQHQNGTYHAHGLLRIGALTKEFEQEFLRHFWQVAFEAYGRNSFTRIVNQDAVTLYVAKYVTKDMADHRFIGFKGFRLTPLDNSQAPKRPN